MVENKHAQQGIHFTLIQGERLQASLPERHVAQVPYGLDFELVAEPDLPLDSAESSSHTVETTCGEDGVTTIRLLHDEESAMDRDLILNLKLLSEFV